MARLSREESAAITCQRVIDAAQTLFRAQGFAATTLEQIAEAATVTKGAIYGHFATKEDLLLSAFESAAIVDYGAVLNDATRPVRERLDEFGRTVAHEGSVDDRAELAVSLEFIATLLRNPPALGRFGAEVTRRLTELAESDDDEPLPGVDKLTVWAIGHALFIGLQLYQFVAPKLYTPEVFGRGVALLAGLYPAD